MHKLPIEKSQYMRRTKTGKVVQVNDKRTKKEKPKLLIRIENKIAEVGPRYGIAPKYYNKLAKIVYDDFKEFGGTPSKQDIVEIADASNIPFQDQQKEPTKKKVPMGTNSVKEWLKDSDYKIINKEKFLKFMPQLSSTLKEIGFSTSMGSFEKLDMVGEIMSDERINSLINKKIITEKE